MHRLLLFLSFSLQITTFPIKLKANIRNRECTSDLQCDSIQQYIHLYDDVIMDKLTLESIFSAVTYIYCRHFCYKNSLNIDKISLILWHQGNNKTNAEHFEERCQFQ